MKELTDTSLARLTTVQIGGTAKRLLIPECREELISIVQNEKPKFFIGGGSNLLIADKEFELVVSLREFDSSILKCDGGEYIVGASVRLQKLISTVNQDGYGGIEYLFSVPGLVGGAIIMNAGRGKMYNQTISDYVQSVTVLEDGEIREYAKAECAFAHRDSRFKHGSTIVLSVRFCFKKQSIEAGEDARKARIERCKTQQDNAGYNFGSVFRTSNGKVLLLVRKLGLRYGNVHFSKKTLNWLVNEGNGTFEDAKKLIVKVEKIHRFLRKDIEREVIVWE